MSFSKLIPADKPKEKTITFEVNGESLVFRAIQVPYFELETIATNAKVENHNHFAGMVAAAIVDSNGDKMTYEQALELPKEYARPLFEAVLDVNGFKESEKN
jgi:hypothetical protein